MSADTSSPLATKAHKIQVRLPAKSLAFLALALLFTYTTIVAFKSRDGRFLHHAVDRFPWVIALLAAPFILGAIVWLFALVVWRSKATSAFIRVVQAVSIALGIWVFATGFFGITTELQSASEERPNPSLERTATGLALGPRGAQA